jgi:hypothetical protein
MSAGGQFNYEFVAWKPERVLAFVVNKGGIYYSALLSQAARNIPGILFVGGKDLEFRTNTITGLFAVNRRGGSAVGSGGGTWSRPRRGTFSRSGPDVFRRCASASAAGVFF